MSPLNACHLLTLHISVNNTLCNMKDMLMVMKPNVLVVNLWLCFFHTNRLNTFDIFRHTDDDIFVLFQPFP